MPKEIKGVDTSPQSREPRRMGRAEPAGSHVETIHPGRYGDGQDRMGINVENAQGNAAKARYRDGEQYRADHRSAPYPK